MALIPLYLVIRRCILIMEELEEIYGKKIERTKFRSPGNMAIYGPSKSGKTHFIFKLIRDMDDMFHFEGHPDKKFKRVYYFYGSDMQPKFQQLKDIMGDKIIFKAGFPHDELNQMIKLENRPALVVLDDLESEIQKNERARRMLTRDSHHLDLFIIMVFQALFDKGNSVRLREQFDIQVFMRYLTSTQGIKRRFAEMVPGPAALKELMEVYREWTWADKGGYMVCDFHSRNTGHHVLFRFRTKIFTDDPICKILIPNYESSTTLSNRRTATADS